MSLAATAFDASLPVYFTQPSNGYSLTFSHDFDSRLRDLSVNKSMMTARPEPVSLPLPSSIGGSRCAGKCSVIPLTVEEQMHLPASTTPDSPPTPPSGADPCNQQTFDQRSMLPQVLPVVVEKLIRCEDEDHIQPNSKLAKSGRSRHFPSAASNVPNSTRGSSSPMSFASNAPQRRKIAQPPVIYGDIDLLQLVSDGLEAPVKWPTIAPIDLQLSDDTSSSSNGRCSDDGGDEDQKRLERKRERNKMAARKCRERKLEKISKLEDQCAQLRDSNNDLLAELDKLKKQVSGLKGTLDQHVASGCNLLQSNVMYQRTLYSS
jgi:hypothetical protein